MYLQSTWIHDIKLCSDEQWAWHIVSNKNGHIL